MATKRYCPRCAKPAIRRATLPGLEIWDCADHGVIYKAGKISPAAQAAPAAAAAPAATVATGTPRKLHAGHAAKPAIAQSDKPGLPSAADLDVEAVEKKIVVATGTPRRLR